MCVCVCVCVCVWVFWQQVIIYLSLVEDHETYFFFKTLCFLLLLSYRLSSRFQVWRPIEFCDSFLFYSSPPLSLYLFFKLYAPFQACQIAANFTADWALSVALADMNAIKRTIRLDTFAHMTFKTSKWKTEFSTDFTVDVATLWTWYWYLFAPMNWSC